MMNLAKCHIASLQQNNKNFVLKMLVEAWISRSYYVRTFSTKNERKGGQFSEF